MRNKAQITIFVIIGIVLVAAVIFLFFIFKDVIIEPQVYSLENPQQFISQCVNDKVDEAVEKIMRYGGYTSPSDLSVNFSYPQGYYRQGVFTDVAFLCYTSINYAPCITIEPNLIEHLEKEVYDYIEEDVKICFISYENSLRNEAYATNFGANPVFEVELMPNRVRINITNQVEFRKAENEVKFNKLNIDHNSRIYNMFIIVQEILRQEGKYYNSDYVEIMNANKWVEIVKYQTGNDLKIYIVKDKVSKKEIKFALRNAVLDTPK
jgi:hypothetical protein